MSQKYIYVWQIKLIIYRILHLPILLAILGIRGDLGSEEKIDLLGLFVLPRSPRSPDCPPLLGLLLESPLDGSSILGGSLVMRPGGSWTEAAGPEADHGLP